MGHYSTLYIGEFSFYWKYDMLPSVMLIFDKDDYHIEYFEETEVDEEKWIEFCGYKTTNKLAKSRFEKIGYTKELVIQIYELLDLVLEEDYDIAMEEHGDYGKNLNLSIEESIDAFVDLLHKSFYINHEKDFIEIVINNHAFELPALEAVYFEDIFNYLDENSIIIPKGLFKIMSIFDYKYEFMLSHEILMLTFFFILQSNPNGDDLISFDYTDLLYGANKDIYEDHFGAMINQLIKTISVQNLIFNTIKENSLDIYSNYYRSEIKRRWNELLLVDDRFKKGKIFENFIVELISHDKKIEIEEVNHRVRDEEIDILFSHDYIGGFWNSIKSACVLIECKNWNKKVGVDEIRNFESKIRNHSNLTKIGVFISINGFCDNSCYDFIKRIGRDDLIIVLITGDDIESFINSGESFEKFLKSKIIDMMK